VVFGRRAGLQAAECVRKAGNGKARLSLEHVRKYNAELKAAGIDNGRSAPMVLPDYRFKIG